MRSFTRIAALAGWALIIFLPLPVWLLIATLLFTGFVSGNLIIGFAFAKESVPARLMDGVRLSATLTQILRQARLRRLDFMLDHHIDGALAFVDRIERNVR